MSSLPPLDPNRAQAQPEEKQRAPLAGPVTEVAVVAKEAILLVVSSVTDTLKATPPTIRKAYSTFVKTVENLKEAIEEHLEEPPKQEPPPEKEGEFIKVDPDEFIQVRQKKKEE